MSNQTRPESVAEDDSSDALSKRGRLVALPVWSSWASQLLEAVGGVNLSL